MRISWTETKRQRVLAERGVDFIDAAGIFEGPCIVYEDRRRAYGERATSLLAKVKTATSSSSTRRARSKRQARAYSTSSLLGERGELRAEDMRSYTFEELRKMRKAGLGRTRPDAAELELDESFWAHAKWMPPLGKSSVHLRVDSDVLEWFKKQGRGHLTRMNAVLRAYYQAHRGK
jgi:uncharacterized protein (DUF4415 family)